MRGQGLYLQNNSENVHQILLSMYFQTGAKAEDMGKGSVLRWPHRILLGYILTIEYTI